MTKAKPLAYGAGLFVVLSLTLFVGWWQVDGPGAREPRGQRPMALSAMGFSLIDHEGNAVGPDTLIGKASLIFFGFTYCPDICPNTLIDITGWLDELGHGSNPLNAIFITVDPERDTSEVLADYVTNFHPAIRGWTGSPSQIRRAANGFRASFEKISTGSGDYTMNHTASVFLFNGAGNFVSTIDIHEPREFAEPKIRRALQQGRNEK